METRAESEGGQPSKLVAGRGGSAGSACSLACSFMSPTWLAGSLVICKVDKGGSQSLGPVGSLARMLLAFETSVS